MLDIGLSPDTAGPRIVGSFRACLSSVLEIPLGEVPQHEENLRAAVGQWRTWLAGEASAWSRSPMHRGFSGPGTG